MTGRACLSPSCPSSAWFVRGITGGRWLRSHADNTLLSNPLPPLSLSPSCSLSTCSVSWWGPWGLAFCQTGQPATWNSQVNPLVQVWQDQGVCGGLCGNCSLWFLYIHLPFHRGDDSSELLLTLGCHHVQVFIFLRWCTAVCSVAFYTCGYVYCVELVRLV